MAFKPSLRTVDLFCGCGGLSLGFQNAGFKIIAAFDNWKSAIEVYNANFDHEARTLNLEDPSTNTIVKKLKPDVIIGGPPCQDFSSAGPNKHSNLRANLVKNFCDVIDATRPKYFILENVPRIRLSAIYESTIKRFKKMNYGLTIKVLDASYCGVPQQRKRLFLIGEKGTKNGFLEKHLESKLSSKPLSLRDYFGSKLDTDYYFRVPTNYKRRGVFSVDEPCVTIRGVDRPIPKGYPRHPEDPVPIGPKVRAFTIKERSFIQTFPKSFLLKGTKTDLNQMIGNAVPVKLAEFVAKAMYEYIEEKHDQ